MRKRTSVSSKRGKKEKKGVSGKKRFVLNSARVDARAVARVRCTKAYSGLMPCCIRKRGSSIEEDITSGVGVLRSITSY